MFNQTLTLTLTNGEVISTYEAGVSDVLKKEFEDAEMAYLGIQASVSDLSSSRSDFSSMSSSNRISHVIQQLTTFNIKKNRNIRHNTRRVDKISPYISGNVQGT